MSEQFEHSVVRGEEGSGAFPKLPPDLAAIEGSLESLAARERAQRAGLEERVFDSTQPAIVSLRFHLVGASETPPRRMRLTPLRLAAAVALLAGGAAAWMASLTGGPGAALVVHRGADTDDELEYNLVLAALDEGWFGTEGELDYLRLETDAVAESLTWDWPLGAEGAM